MESTILHPARELVFIAEVDPDCGYSARAVGESIFTQGATIEEARDNLVEALSLFFECADGSEGFDTGDGVGIFFGVSGEDGSEGNVINRFIRGGCHLKGVVGREADHCLRADDRTRHR